MSRGGLTLQPSDWLEQLCNEDQIRQRIVEQKKQGSGHVRATVLYDDEEELQALDDLGGKRADQHHAGTTGW